MLPSLTLSLRSARRRTERLVDRRPELPVLAIAGVAWVFVLRAALETSGAAGLHHVHSPASMLSMPGMAMGAGHLSPMWVAAEAAGLWVAMTVAMMLPLTVPSLRHIGRMVPRSGRAGASATFSTAFVVTWLPGVALAVWIHSWLPVPAWVAAAAFVVAGAWELTPVKRRALLRCHRNAVVRAAQPARRRTCWSFGVRRGAWCVASCGPAMVALVLCGHALVPLALLTAVLTVQQFSADAYRSRTWTAAALAAIALYPTLIT